MTAGVLGMGCKLKHLQSSSSHRNKRQQDKGIKQIHLSAPLMHCSPHYFCNHTHKHTHTHKHRHLGYDAFSRSSTLPNAATQLKTCRGRATPPSRARPIRSTLPQDLDLDPRRLAPSQHDDVPSRSCHVQLHESPPLLLCGPLCLKTPVRCKRGISDGNTKGHTSPAVKRRR